MLHSAPQWKVQQSHRASRSPSASRKRRKHYHEGEPPAGDTIWLFPAATSSLDSSQPLSARPVGITSRSRLPLASLNPCKSSNLSGRLFRSVQPLSCKYQCEKDVLSDRIVLIAGIDHQPGFYAVENIQDNIYSLSEVVGGIDQAVFQGPPAYKSSVSRRPIEDTTGYSLLPEDWWVDLALPISAQSKGPHMSGDTSEHFKATTVSTELPQIPNLQDGSNSIQSATEEVLSDTPDTALRSLIIQYLDFLYVSKASHAYFAKAPLARVRGAYQKIHDTQALIQALRHMILTSACLNKKYKAVIPDLLKTRSLEASSVDALKVPKSSRSSKLKKPKPNRDGLYSVEESYILRWWASEQSATHSDTSALPMQAAQQLRYRETLLQIILILEVVTLESQVQRASNGREGQTAVHGQEPILSKASRRKPQDLKLLLDIYIDSLCIHQSLQDLHIKQTDTIQKSVEEDVSPLDLATDMDSSKGVHDELKDFYIAVAIPFYGSKIPKIIETLGWKAGARIGGVTSPRGKTTKSHSTLHKPVPGTEVKRRWPRQAMESPERVIIAEAGEPPRAQLRSLSRSTTDPFLRPFERTKSMASQAAPFLGDSRRSLSRASSVAQSARGRTREVDMGAIHKFNESRQKKPLSIEQELKVAIATLKKPNRGMAIKDYVEAADARRAPNSTFESGAKKSGTAVQVGATPRRVARTVPESLSTPQGKSIVTTPPGSQESFGSDAVGTDSMKKLSTLIQPYEAQNQWSVPTESSRAHDHRKVQGDINTEAERAFLAQSTSTSSQSVLEMDRFKRPARPSHVQHKPTKSIRNGEIHSKVNVTATPTKPRAQTAGKEAAKITHVTATPLKTKLIVPGRAQTLATCEPSSLSEDQSFYAKLGWNDEDIDELL